MKKKLVEIEWLDADCSSGWLEDNEKEDQKIEYMKAYGLLVSRGKSFTVISFLYNKESKEWLGKARIPSSWVKKIRTIEEVDV